MAEVWPDDLPTCLLLENYTEQPETNVAEFAAEVGPPLRRRRSSVATALITGSVIWTKAEIGALLEFHRDTLRDGALTFIFTHPRTGDLEEFIFTSPPVVSPVSDTHWRANLSFRSMPGNCD
jgi:hypothetical protein